MLEIKKSATAGTLESSDIHIAIEPNQGKGIHIELDSVVQLQFGDAIAKTVQNVLDDFAVKDARIILTDKGAIDAVIIARLQTAICRAAEITYDWSKEDTHGK